MSSKTTTATTPQNENSLGSSIILFVLMMVLFLALHLLAELPDAGQPVADGRLPGPVRPGLLDSADHHRPLGFRGRILSTTSLND